MNTITFELRSDGCAYDKNGLMIMSLVGINYTSYESDVSDTTLELIKQGVSVDDIIKLKNMELL